MRVVAPESLEWKASEHYRSALISSQNLGSSELRIEMLEIASGQHVPAHLHRRRKEYLTVTFSAGAQIQIGQRIFRPIAGQVFEREAGEVFAATNDTKHPFRVMVTRIGYDENDIEWVDLEEDEDDDGGGQEQSDTEMSEDAAGS